MDVEHQAKLEKRSDADKADEVRKREQETESARLRQARKRKLEKEEDVEAGKRDHSGKIVKASPSISNPLSDRPAPSLNAAEPSRPWQAIFTRAGAPTARKDRSPERTRVHGSRTIKLGGPASMVTY